MNKAKDGRLLHLPSLFCAEMDCTGLQWSRGTRDTAIGLLVLCLLVSALIAHPFLHLWGTHFTVGYGESPPSVLDLGTQLIFIING